MTTIWTKKFLFMPYISSSKPVTITGFHAKTVRRFTSTKYENLFFQQEPWTKVTSIKSYINDDQDETCEYTQSSWNHPFQPRR